MTEETQFQTPSAHSEPLQPDLPLRGGMAAARRCQTCKASKPLTDFAPHNASRYGRRAHCKECCLTGRKRPFVEGPEQRARRAKRQSHKVWRRSHAAALERHAARYPLAEQARRIAAAAVRSGRLEKAAHCQVQGCKSMHCLEAHHHDYSKPLEVLWACAAHHRQGHAAGRIIPAKGIPAHYGDIPEPR